MNTLYLIPTNYDQPFDESQFGVNLFTNEEIVPPSPKELAALEASRFNVSRIAKNPGPPRDMEVYDIFGRDFTTFGGQELVNETMRNLSVQYFRDGSVFPNVQLALDGVFVATDVGARVCVDKHKLVDVLLGKHPSTRDFRFAPDVLFKMSSSGKMYDGILMDVAAVIPRIRELPINRVRPYVPLTASDAR